MSNPLRNRKTTIRDVAAQAGVSYQTVSRVLNNSTQVRQGTREQVLKVIEQLGYSPDPVATSLATNRSYTLGMITATFTGNSMVHVLEGADAYALQNGYQILISGEEHRSKSEPLYVPFIKRQRVDGVLIIYHGSKNDHHQILRDIPESIPVVSTGYAFNQDNILAVRVNTRKGAKDAIDHLLGLGHRCIAMITGAAGAYETVERNIGYRQALKNAVIRYEPSLVVEGDWFVESGYQAARVLSNTGKRFSAVFAHSDRMAMGCISALVEQGIRVPEDVAVVGFNNIEEAGYFNPPLTTIYYPAHEHGRICAKLLIALTEGEKYPERKLSGEELKSLETHLIIRRSCGAELKARGG